ncbi:hypothetical protein BKI52_19850 [marine bacterium AO1-C]|nr:hypothetical protein BKI52_19850 [marine bacterium AO1-C]
MDSEKYPIHKYIYEWLLDHESIIVPELGQFVAEFKGASIHPSIHSISPPNKTIIFNSEPKNDDGELAGFIAQKEGLSLFDADEVIRKFVSELKIGLASDQKYELPAFGVFTKNPEGTIEFQADEAINFAGDSFGFPKLFYKPVEKKEDASFFDRDFDTTEEKPFEQKPLVDSSIEEKSSMTTTAGFGTPANDDHVKTPFDDDDDDDLDDDFDDERRRPAWLMPVIGVVAAGLVITAGVFIVPNLLGGSKSTKETTKDSTEKVAQNNTDTNTTTSTEVKIDDTTGTGTSGTSTTENTNTTTKDNGGSTTTGSNDNGGNSTTANTTNTTSSNNTASTNTSGTTTRPTYTPPANTGGTNNSLFKTLPYRPQTPASAAIINAPTSRFYIIVASFSARVNAYSLYNNLKTQGYDAKIIPPVEGSSMHRVASGSYASEDEANRNLRRLTGRLGSEIWVKKY